MHTETTTCCVAGAGPGVQVMVLRDLYPRSGAQGPTAADAGAGDPIPVRLMRRLPPMRHLAGRFTGMGVGLERVRTAAVARFDSSGGRR